MKDYIYDEEKYFNGDLSEYEDRMTACGYTPAEIENDKEFQSLLDYLLTVIEQSPLFIPAYEYALEMLYELEPNEELTKQIENIEKKRLSNAMKVAEMDDIFNKKVEWGWLENRPLVRAIYYNGYRMWEQGDFNGANDIFLKLYKSNENDEVGARFAIKATSEKMTPKEFDKKFVGIDDDGTFYRIEELNEWLNIVS